MGFLHKLFGKGDPIARMRRALEQKRWADALAIGSALEPAGISSERQAELANLLTAAGNGLAELNLVEGESCLRAGDKARAAEHFTLATEQVCDPELRQRIAAATASLVMSAPRVEPLPPAANDGCGSGCSSPCGNADTAGATGGSPDEDLDTQTRLELILASYPEGWAERYLQLGGSFREAFLLAHEGRADDALAAFDAVQESARDDLFYFERGALHGRIGETAKACSDLEEALERNPGHFLAIDTLLHLELATGNVISAEQRLNLMLSQRVAPAFCHGNLAAIKARKGDLSAALDHGLQAIASGERGMETLLLTSSLLERAGRTDEAEKVLMCFPGGGCSGGSNLPLAEFWLRHEKNLDKALESFKGALRSEPGNPRWLLRVAQVYLARGWKKEGISLLESALATPGLEPVLLEEGTALLETART